MGETQRITTPDESSDVPIGIMPADMLHRRAQVLRKPPATHYGAIDIGTNSIHFVMVEISPDGDFQVIGSDKEMVRLGNGGFARGELTQEAMDAGIATLRRFLRMAELKGVSKIKAVATSAVRESRNGGDFVKRCLDELDLPVSVISMAEEGRLIYLGVQHAVDLGPSDNLIVDIGGGSVELIVGSAEQAKCVRSVKLGGSRLAELFLQSDPYAPDEVKALRHHVRMTLGPDLAALGQYPIARCIGTSGTIRVLAAIAGRRRSPAADTASPRIERAELKMLADELAVTARTDRLKFPGMDARRADGCLPVATVLLAIMKRLDVRVIEYCNYALREGVIVDYIGTHRRKLLARATWPDPRMRSVVELAERCNYQKEHAEHVALLALQLFDALAPLHQLDRSYRELLYIAALLHDIGHLLGHQGHHKHSYYLISNGRLKGFDNQEIQVVANVARYHRRDRPRKTHYSFQHVEPSRRGAVRRLAVMLRLAEALDRTHAGVIEAVACRIAPDTVEFLVRTEHDAELELWTARRSAEFFEREFKRHMIVRIENVAHMPQAQQVNHDASD
jgi:exopolyphosphatase/guanosine-5'-triphosphate,3'-diphosphate pyrophosphatase